MLVNGIDSGQFWSSYNLSGYSLGVSLSDYPNLEVEERLHITCEYLSSISRLGSFFLGLVFPLPHSNIDTLYYCVFKMSATESIALIGSTCRSLSGSDTPPRLWELLREPRDLLQKTPEKRRWHPDSFYHRYPEHHGTTDVKPSYFLDHDPAHFDNTFFNIQPSVCEAIDPQ
jgi:hypothetical protein